MNSQLEKAIHPVPSRAFEERVAETREERNRVRRLVATKRRFAADPDILRRTAFLTRDIIRPQGREAVQGPTNDLQPVSYFVEGAAIRRAVAYVEVNDPRKSALGSGFLISPRLLLSNCHVIQDALAAQAAFVTFDREMTHLGGLASATTFQLDPAAFALFSEEKELDYALVAVGGRVSGTAELRELGYCPLEDTPDRHVIGMNVNIIQHPNGLPKMVAVRENILTWRTERTLLYDTDTDVGSSGSPVFNDTWDVVALHHWGHPYLEQLDEHGTEIPVTVNEGVRISAIYRDLQRQLPQLDAEQQAMLKDALSAAERSPEVVGRKRLGPPRPRGPESLISQTQSFDRGNVMAQPTVVHIKLGDVEITIHQGAGANAGIVDPPAVQRTVVPATPKLTPGAEAIQVDEDYSNRAGFDPTFIPGLEVPLPEPDAKLLKQVAPLRAGEPSAAKGELKYEHFSIKMNKSKQLAIFTATNIDGETYLSVNRKTGEVGPGPEGEKWFKDPRISETFWTGQDFYSEWSNYFDRGHLTRRTDPTWGTPEEAERANADTYHFTNCSPQHFRFNQTAKYWQGAEQYVLEKGVLAAESKRRICVLQGPIFDSAIDQFAGDLQIPSSFFKVIVWRGESGSKAVGLIVDQLALLDEERINLGPPRKPKTVNVQQWRVAIKQIEKRTGLQFGDRVINADTIGAAGQPGVGAEALIPIASFEDILR